MAFYIDVENPADEEPDVVTPEDRAAIVADVLTALGRQPDGTAGFIAREVYHALGGYDVDNKYVDGLLVVEARKKLGVSKHS